MVQELGQISVHGPRHDANKVWWYILGSIHCATSQQCLGPAMANGCFTFVFRLRHLSQLLWTRCAFAARVEVLEGRGPVISAMTPEERPGVFVTGADAPRRAHPAKLQLSLRER